MQIKIGSKVFALKGAPSATAVNQQLDVSPRFRDCRAEKNDVAPAEWAAAGVGAAGAAAGDDEMGRVSKQRGIKKGVLSKEKR